MGYTRQEALNDFVRGNQTMQIYISLAEMLIMGAVCLSGCYYIKNGLLKHRALI